MVASMKSQAPWNRRQVEALKRRQAANLHPYTCPLHSATSLVPTARGWTCRYPGCDYTQDWALEADTRFQSHPNE
jgi:hypothetical protein